MPTRAHARAACESNTPEKGAREQQQKNDDDDDDNDNHDMTLPYEY